jgi:hypothetical protein
MPMHLSQPVSRLMNYVGAACAFVIIIGMLATAIAPLFAPLW